MGLQRSQFLNSLANWEKFESATQAYIQKSNFFIFFKNWEKLRSPARAIFKNPILFVKWENLGSKPWKTNTQKIPIFNLWMNSENFCPNLSLKIRYVI